MVGPYDLCNRQPSWVLTTENLNNRFEELLDAAVIAKYKDTELQAQQALLKEASVREEALRRTIADQEGLLQEMAIDLNDANTRIAELTQKVK